MKELIIELRKAKESKISSWIDEVSRKIDMMEDFFKIAKKVNLIIKGKYISGIPKGNKDDINTFYLLEGKLGYPEPQKVTI